MSTMTTLKDLNLSADWAKDACKTCKDLNLSADWVKDACKTCGGDGRVAQFTPEAAATMHQVNPPHRGAAMLKCLACDGTGKIP